MQFPCFSFSCVKHTREKLYEGNNYADDHKNRTTT